MNPGNSPTSEMTSEQGWFREFFEKAENLSEGVFQQKKVKRALNEVAKLIGIRVLDMPIAAKNDSLFRKLYQPKEIIHAHDFRNWIVSKAAEIRGDKYGAFVKICDKYPHQKVDASVSTQDQKKVDACSAEPCDTEISGFTKEIPEDIRKDLPGVEELEYNSERGVIKFTRGKKTQASPMRDGDGRIIMKNPIFIIITVSQIREEISGEVLPGNQYSLSFIQSSDPVCRRFEEIGQCIGEGICENVDTMPPNIKTLIIHVTAKGFKASRILEIKTNKRNNELEFEIKESMPRLSDESTCLIELNFHGVEKLRRLTDLPEYKGFINDIESIIEAASLDDASLMKKLMAAMMSPGLSMNSLLSELREQGPKQLSSVEIPKDKALNLDDIVSVRFKDADMKNTTDQEKEVIESSIKRTLQQSQLRLQFEQVLSNQGAPPETEKCLRIENYPR